MKKQKRMENKMRKNVALANLFASNEKDGKSKKPKRKREHVENSPETEETVASTSSESVRTMNDDISANLLNFTSAARRTRSQENETRPN
jgi:hypothetical protein